MNIKFINERNAFHNYGHFTHDNLIHLFNMLKQKNLLNKKNTLYLNPKLNKWHFILEHLDINIKYKKCNNPDIILNNPLNIIRKNKLGKIVGLCTYKETLEQNISSNVNKACNIILKSLERKNELASYYTKKLNIDIKKNSKNVLIIDRDLITDCICIINKIEFYKQITDYFYDIGFNVNIINFNGLSLKEQINHVNNCSIIIGYLGAGFANTIYCKNNPYIIEIIPYNYSYKIHSVWANTDNFETINVKKGNSICSDRLIKIYKKKRKKLPYPKSRDQDSYVYISDIKDSLNNIVNKIKLKYIVSIKNQVDFEGICLHSGTISKCSLKPSKKYGIRINNIELDINKITSTDGMTEFNNISLTEHILSPIYHLGINSLDITVSKNEFPILDGSAKQFYKKLYNNIELIEPIDININIVKIKETYIYQEGDRFIKIEPSNELTINYKTDYNNIGSSETNYKYSDTTKYEELMIAPTSWYEKPFIELKKSGKKFQGAIIGENFFPIKEHNNVNPKQFSDHKVMDLLGDLMIANKRIIGKITANKAGHKFHIKLLKKILESYDYFNIPNIPYFNEKYISKINQKYISPYKNKHIGETCVLFGGGKTVNKYKPLKNVIHIGCNNIFEFNVIMDYYFVMDYNGSTTFKNNKECITNYKPNICKFYGKFKKNFHKRIKQPGIPDQYIKDNISQFEISCFGSPPCIYLPPKDVGYYCFGLSYSTIFIMIQFALYCGFKKILLVGCDLYGSNFKNEKHNFIEKQNKILEFKSVWKSVKKWINNEYKHVTIEVINPIGLKNIFYEYK